MIFVYAITTPKNTPQSAPLATAMPIAAGKITRVEIQFPLGVSASTHIAINYGLFQLFPTNQDGAVATSNETVSWDEDLEFDQPPFSLTAYTWNTSTSNPHTLTVRIVMQSPPGVSNVQDQIASLLELIGAPA